MPKNYENYEIIFENINLSYKDDLDDQFHIKWILKDFNLRIKKGEKIALCGRTGSGKTSILNILFRFYPI